MKIKIRFPQVILEEKEVEITSVNEMYDVLDGSVPLIWSKMSELEQRHTYGIEMVEGMSDNNNLFLLTEDQKAYISKQIDIHESSDNECI